MVQEEMSHSALDVDLKNNITKELFKTLDRFFNEIELVFDYIQPDKVYHLRKFLKSLKDNRNLVNFVKDTFPVLEMYETEIFKITTANGKLKSIDFKFLEEIVLFNNVLDFSVFKDENKNTKASLVKYLHGIYTSVLVLNFSINIKDHDVLPEQVYNFIENIKQSIDKSANVQKPTEKYNKKNNN